MSKLNHFIFCSALCAVTFACTREERTVPEIETNESETELTQEVIEPDSIDTQLVQENPVEVVNVVSIDTKDNVVEFHQSFSANQEMNLGEINDLDLSNTSGGMISAYSLDVSDYEVFFRVQEKGDFREWTQMKLSDHVENPNRKVWNANPLSEAVEKIQFKSTGSTNSEVVFRVFKFAKN